MKKFNFSLQTLDNYKEHLLSNEKGILKYLLERRRILAIETQTLRSEQTKYTITYTQKMISGTNSSELILIKNYIKTLQEKMNELAEQIQRLDIKITHQQSVVTNLSKDEKALGKLKEKQYEIYKKELMSEEERFINEFVSNTSAVGLSN